MSTEAKPAEARAEVLPGLTARAIILAIVLTLAALVVNFWTWAGIRITLEPFYGGRIGAPIYMPFGFVWLLLLISVAVKKKLSPAEVAFIITVIYLTMDAPFTFFGFVEGPLGIPRFATKFPDVKDLIKYVPDFYCPKEYEVVKPIYEGGGVPGAVMGYVALAMFIALLYLLLQFFLTWIIKEQYVKVEKLPFPSVLPVVETIRYNETQPLTAVGFHKYFYIGLILGLLVSIPCTINYIVPLFPVFFAYGQIYLTAWRDFWKGVNPSISEWWMFISADMVVFFLAPLDVSFSVTLWTGFVSLIWPFIAVGAGLVPPGKHAGWGGPVPLWRFSQYAVTLALGFWAIVFGFRTYWNSLKEAFARKASSEEPGRIPMIIPWAGFIAVALIYIIFWSAIGANPGLLILMLILWVFFMLTYARVYAETGQWAGSYPWTVRNIVGTVGLSTGAIPSNPYPSTSTWATMAAYRHLVMGPYTVQTPNTVWGMLCTYYLGYETKTKERDIFIAQLLAIIILVFIAVPIYLGIMGSFGANKLWAWYLTALEARGVRNFDTKYCVTKGPVVSDRDVGLLVAAFIVVGVLWFLRLRFPWFIFTPVALWAYSGMWFLSAAPAFVIKIIVLKVFGVKTYEKYAVPIAVGYLVGLSFGAMVGITGLLFYKAPWAA